MSDGRVNMIEWLTIGNSWGAVINTRIALYWKSSNCLDSCCYNSKICWVKLWPQGGAGVCVFVFFFFPTVETELVVI